MSGPDVQRNLDPRRLFSPHNDLGELLALLHLQLRFAERSAILEFNEELKVVQAYVSGSRAAGSTNPLSSVRDEQYFAADDHPP